MLKSNDTLDINGGKYMGFIVDFFDYDIFGSHYEIKGFSTGAHLGSIRDVREFIDKHIKDGINILTQPNG
jgi:hypothetical protein